jgi:hypothetical protein
MTKQIAILQVAKMAFFPRHCHFLQFRCNLLKNMRKYQKLFEKCFQKNDIFATCKIDIFFSHFLSFGGIFVIFCHFGAICSKICKNIENYSKNDRKMTKNDDAFIKITCLQPAKLSFFWGVIFWSFCGFFVISCHFGAILSKILKNIKNYSKNHRKKDKIMTMSREKCHFCTLQNCHFLSFFGRNFVKNMEI